MAEVVLFEHVNYQGAHKHLYTSEPNLNGMYDSYFHDKVSSFVVLSGTWQFYSGVNYGAPASNVFGPGLYNWVEAFGIPNDSISSVRRVS